MYPSGSQRRRGPPFKWRTQVDQNNELDQNEQELDYNDIVVSPQDSRTFTIQFAEKLPKDVKDEGLIAQFERCIANIGDVRKT